MRKANVLAKDSDGEESDHESVVEEEVPDQPAEPAEKPGKKIGRPVKDMTKKGVAQRQRYAEDEEYRERAKALAKERRDKLKAERVAAALAGGKLPKTADPTAAILPMMMLQISELNDKLAHAESKRRRLKKGVRGFVDALRAEATKPARAPSPPRAPPTPAVTTQPAPSRPPIERPRY